MTRIATAMSHSPAPPAPPSPRAPAPAAPNVQWPSGPPSPARRLLTPLFPGYELPEGTSDHITRAEWWSDVTELAFIVQRWRLIIFTVPIVALFIGLRWTEWNGRSFAAPLDYTIVAPLTTSVVFVCATMLSNVVSDYKEGEKMPAELTGYFQSLLAASVMQEAQHARRAGEHSAGAHDEDSSAEPGAALRHLESLFLCVIGFLDGRWPYNVALNSFIENEMALCAQLEAWGRTDMEHIEHLLTEMRKKLCRVHDISRTSIILPLYTLIDTLTLSFLMILILADYDYERSGYATLVVLGGLAVYMNLLNRDLDDPFVYPKGYHLACYVLGRRRPITMMEAFKSGPSINFECLTVDFGGMLKLRLAESGLQPYSGPLQPPAPEAVAEAGPGAATPRSKSEGSQA